FLHRADHLPLKRQDSQPDIRGHERSKHCANMNVGSAAAHHMGDTEYQAKQKNERNDRSSRLISRNRRDPDRVIDDPGKYKEDQTNENADTDTTEGLSFHKPTQVINNDEQCRPAQPCHGGFPPKPMQSLRQSPRNLPPFNDIKTAAVNQPQG